MEWLGDVPEHWQIVRTKDIFNHRKEEALEDDEIVTAFRDGQVTLRKNRRTDGFTNSIKEHGYQHINSGDLVIHEMDAFAGAIGVSDSSGKSTPVYSVCYAKNENINHHFYSHFFRTMAKTGFINSLAKGIRVRSTEFRWNESRNVYLALPPQIDQQKIVSFLNTETARIATLIAKQEKLIELLEEQRKSIISHAVTKGLNPNAPMKDSGVEWLGEVPEHWDVKSYRFVSKIYRGKFGHRPRNDPSLYDGEYPFIQTGDVARAGKYIQTYSQTLNEKGKAVSQVFTSGTLVMAIAANIGDTAILNFEAYAPDSVVGFKPHKNIDLEFLRFSFIASLQALEQTAVQSTQANLNVERIGALKTTFPPLSEQIEISNYLNAENEKNNHLISKQNQLIEKLKEYRASIISHAVTGKIDVREFGA